MDVSLVSKTGLPDDAIISIRSGAVRRQGAVSGDKPFRFPQVATDGDCVVKVDIMQTIGSGYIVMRPNQNQGKQYEVKFNDTCSCEIEISPTDGSAAPEAAETAATAKTKQDAKAYLEGTGLLPFVQGVLQVVAKQQPQDPFAAMASHFISASDEAVAPQSGGPKSAPSSPKKSPTSPKASEHVAAQDSVETPTQGGEAPGQVASEEAAAETAGTAAAAEQKPAEAAQEEAEAKEQNKEEDIDDHKSDSDVEVQFTATVKGKELTAAANAEVSDQDKPAEESEKPAEVSEDKPAEAVQTSEAPDEQAAEKTEQSAEQPSEAVEKPAEAAEETPAEANETPAEPAGGESPDA